MDSQQRALQVNVQKKDVSRELVEYWDGECEY
jgi:hypothetical protein